MKGILLSVLMMGLLNVAFSQQDNDHQSSAVSPLSFGEGSGVGLQRVDTIDYSYLKFIPLDSFYRSKNINIINADNPDLYFETYDWLNAPYRWGGKSKKGIDCSGFVSYVFNKLYKKTLGGSAGDIFKKCNEVIPTELQEGDLLFFNINGKYLYHVGIYLQNGMFAHAAVHGGVIISSMEEKYYQRWFYKAGRVKDQ